MENIEYANVYSEVLEILKYISKEDYNKIPKQKIELFETNANKDYKFEYNIDKTLDEQNVSKTAKTIIAILFRDYWATESQREKIIAKENYDRAQLEEQKREQYNPDDIFKGKRIQKVQDMADMEQENVAMVEYKQGLFSKIIGKIKNIFHIK